MEPQRWAEIESIYHAALAQAPHERTAYLEDACSGDMSLRSEVESLLCYAEVQLSNPFANASREAILRFPNIAFKEFPKPFQAEQIVAGRFEIIREIGEGGMGVVYEAFDRKRNLRVAIKAAKPGFQRLLSPELEGSLTVRHFNVCRVNEIHTERTDLGEVDFLTMELLEGETLAAYLKARGKLPQAEALLIARQLCAGMAEAHRSDIIHRDFKSANIILCRSRNAELRAVITDFGLAGGARESADFAGTPVYMAPELWQGEKTSKASDIYALGVVLYEMVVDPKLEGLGRGKTWRPDLHGLSKPWAQAIECCVDASPAKRASSAAEILAILEKRPSPWRFLLGLPIIFLFALVFPQIRTRVHDSIWTPPNIRLVVLPATVPASMSETSGGILQDVSARVSHMKSESRAIAVISPTEASKLSVKTPEQAHEMRATHILQTSMRQDGPDFIVQGSLIDVKDQFHLSDFSRRYTAATLGVIPLALAGQISAGLHLKGSASAEALSPAATIAYDRGLYILSQDGQNTEGAIRLFEEASRLDPQSPLPPAGLVEAEVKNFLDTKDSAYLTQAENYLRAAENLNPDSVSMHLAAGMLHETSGQYEKAREQYFRVRDIEPHNVEALIRIADVYDKLDAPDKAVETYQKAIELDPSFYKPYQYLGTFYYFRGRYAEAAEQFRKVTERAPGMYRAYTNLEASLENLGEYAEAERVVRNSLKLRETAVGLHNMGTLLACQKRDMEAVSYYERAVALKPQNYVYLLNLADSNRRLSRSGNAKTEYREGMELALAELKENPRNGYVRAFVAYFAARLGMRERAEDEIGQALHLSPNDNRVILRAVLTYEALGLRNQALAALGRATSQLVRELSREPDLAEFSEDSRFKSLVDVNKKGDQ